MLWNEFYWNQLLTTNKNKCKFTAIFFLIKKITSLCITTIVWYTAQLQNENKVVWSVHTNCGFSIAMKKHLFPHGKWKKKLQHLW